MAQKSRKKTRSFGFNSKANRQLTTSRFQAILVIGLVVIVGSVYLAIHAASGITNLTGVVSASTCPMVPSPVGPNPKPTGPVPANSTSAGTPAGLLNSGCRITVGGVSTLIESGNVVYPGGFGRVIDAPAGSMVGYKVAIHAAIIDATHATLAGSTGYYAKFLGNTIRFTGVAKNSTCGPNTPRSVSPGNFGCSITVNGITVLIRQGNVSYPGGFGQVINAPAGTMNQHRVQIYAQQTGPATATLAGSPSYFARFTN